MHALLRLMAPRRFEVVGLHCEGCCTTLESALKKLDGVDSATVRFDDHTVTIAGGAPTGELLAAAASAGKLLHALDAEGRRTVTLKVDGMSCEHCSNSVQEKLAEVPGVAVAIVELEKGCATVTGRALSEQKLVSAVEAAGMVAIVMGSTATVEASPAKLAGDEKKAYDDGEEHENDLGQEQQQPVQVVHLKVDGMSCEHWCALDPAEDGQHPLLSPRVRNHHAPLCPLPVRFHSCAPSRTRPFPRSHALVRSQLQPCARDALHASECALCHG